VHHHHSHARPADGSATWHSEDGLHIDLRGQTGPFDSLLGTLDGGEVDGAVIGHFDREPIDLYAELEERGWTHEAVDQHCGGDCEGGFMLRMVRWGR